MSNEDAIKVLENTKVMVLKGSVDELQLACSMAIKALEKHIPKKVIYHDNCGNLTPNQPRCPRCYEAANDTWHWAGESYCEYCGQAIDWSE